MFDRQFNLVAACALLLAFGCESGSGDTEETNVEGTQTEPTASVTAGTPVDTAPAASSNTPLPGASNPTAMDPTPPTSDPTPPNGPTSMPPPVPTDPEDDETDPPDVNTSDESSDPPPASGDELDASAPEPGTEPGTDPPQEIVACDTPEEETFSFFMISYDAIRRFSGSDDGFGGDLGGITGADSLCERAATESSPCAVNKTWRAFLSTTTEDAIDRIGTGPWRDRVGRLLANNTEELLNDRPPNADPEIINDFPNEYGIPNQFPNSDSEPVDNHQTLTGSGIDGRLYTQSMDAGVSGADDEEPGGGRPGGGGGSTYCKDGWTPEKATCWDWTSKEPAGCPRVGHSWPSEFSGVNWISVWNESGCAPGVTLVQGPLEANDTVGAYGGYGGFYCFAETYGE